MKLKNLSLLVVVFSLLLSACAPQATATPAAVEPTAVVTEAPATAVVTEAPLVTEAPAPTEVPTAEPTAVPPEPVDLNVFAAASLTEPFGEIGEVFEASHPGVTVVFNFAGSQQLAQQINEGAPADVFASANRTQMNVVIEAGGILTGTQQTFVMNRLVLIFPKDNPGGIAALADLTKSGLKLVFAAAEVPVGQYSLDFLDKAVADPEFGSAYKDDVLKNVVSYEDNVKAVLTKVALGEADAGIVYLSDISGGDADKVDRLDIPDALNVIASYPIAPVAETKQPELAQAFIDLVVSAEGQGILEKFNFIPAAKPAAAAGEIVVTDALGREVRLPKPPEKIVLTGKALFMVADAIYAFPEASNRIAAIGNTQQGSGNFVSLLDPAYDAKAKLESDAGPEQIAAVQPDLVILKSITAETLGAPLEAIDLPVVYVDFETPEQYKRDLATLGQIFQNEARAQEVADFYQERIDRVSEAVSGLSDGEKPRSLILYYSDKDGEIAFNVPPMTWMQTYLVQTAGGIPVWEDANPGQGWTKVSLEQVAAWDPDQVFIVSYFVPVAEVIEGLKADPQWQELRAMKEGKVFGFASDLYSWDQPDTRWVLGLLWLAKTMHPDLFADMDIQQEAQVFYQDLYGMDAATFEKDVLPTFAGDMP